MTATEAAAQVMVKPEVTGTEAAAQTTETAAEAANHIMLK